ncbi:hypothetical protein EH165_03690 [Nakamurella antarctica]|uniref:Ig-like domain (Group 3) n=1 Tax=Nakamurella antarctica TaxID=1902245 RepID=A0A3G8ZKM6_9ACTN|nr:hypothetical protein [Nakamurella antarctica]AZI57395.1 hypothetical protein EH165_03690 [Nakamurella antarctica]
MQRGRISASLLALATCGAFIVVANSPAFAGADAVTVRPAAVAATPVTSTDAADMRTLTAESVITLTPSGATIAVTGAGFDPANNVYVALCNKSAAAETPLLNCLGGSIPDANTSKAWATVSNDPALGNRVAWTGKGFTANIVLTSPDGVGPVCGDADCVIIARTTGDPAKRAADLLIPVTFASDAPPASSPASTASTPASTSAPRTSTPTPTTETTPTTIDPPSAPLTVGAQSVVSPEVAVGGTQTVVFAQFKPGEQVGVTVFSTPVALPPVVASSAGVVTITFPITKDLLPGLHSVQAVGVESGTVGTAEFTVVAAAAPSTTSAVTTSEPTSASVAPTSSAEVSTQSATSESAVTTAESTAAVAAPDQKSGSNLAWLWVVIIVVLIVGGVTGAVYLSRRRESILVAEEEDKNLLLAEARVSSEPEPQTLLEESPEEAAAYGYSGSDFHLLSGHNHSDGPALYSGQGGYTPDVTTQRIQTPQHPGAGASPTDEPTAWFPAPAQDQPATPQMPSSARQPISPDSGPSTSQWRPAFDETSGDGAFSPADSGSGTESDSGAESDPGAYAVHADDAGPEGATSVWQVPPTRTSGEADPPSAAPVLDDSDDGHGTTS